MKILLAEDDSQVRDELTELLSEDGHQLTSAADGIEAFEKFRDEGLLSLPFPSVPLAFSFRKLQG